MAFEFTDQNVKQIIESGKPVMIDCWATWCGPCKSMAPSIDELADEYAEKVVIGKYNVDEQGDLSNEYRIMSLPTILFFKDGKNLTDLRMVGAQPKEALRARIEKLLEA
ncbi:MAG: thioredoxin [Bacteroides sp.]|nr:thioredoxin [Bacteroides sp.]MBD5377637.1 thioredoxin [Bacteroides sp.]